MWILYDFIILIFLIGTGVFLLEVVSKRKTLKNKTIVVLFAGAFLCCWMLVFYGSFIEPKKLVVNEQDVSISENPIHNIRAAVISDIHVGPYKKARWVDKVVAKTNSLEPDVIFILGDFIFSSSNDVEMLGPLKNLSAKYGVFAVTGNHDYIGKESEKVINALKKLNISVLENTNLRLIENDNLVLAGVSDIWFAGNIYSTLTGVSSEDNVILLTHNPDVVLSSISERADLVLAAHTHGGQIRLPYIGPVAPLPTKLGRKYDKGLFLYNDLKLFITSGVSETGTRARLFNPPEIALLNINY